MYQFWEACFPFEINFCLISWGILVISGNNNNIPEVILIANIAYHIKSLSKHPQNLRQEFQQGVFLQKQKYHHSKLPVPKRIRQSLWYSSLYL